MPLCEISVARLFPDNHEYHTHGSFVIDTSLNTQDEIVALLSDGDMGRIGEKLDVIPHSGYPMPPNLVYGLSGFALNPIEVPPTPTFTSDGGYKVWAKPLPDNRLW